MDRLPWVLLLVTLTALPAMAAPRIGVCTNLHRFDSQSGLEPLTHQFTLENTGTDTLEIGDVRTSCGCTAAITEQRTLAPGQQVALTVTTRFSPMPGPQRKNIIVTSNDPLAPELMLQVEATLRHPILLEPHQLHLGTLAPGAAFEREVDAFLEDPATTSILALTILDGDTQTPAPDTDTWRITARPAAHGYTLTLAGTAPQVPGSRRLNLLVETDHPAAPQTLLPLSMQVAGVLSHAPATITVLDAMADDGQGQIRYATVRRSDRGDTTPFAITRVVAPHPGVAVDVQPIGPAYRIRLSGLDPTQITATSVLIVETDVDTMKEIHIPFERRSQQ